MNMTATLGRIVGILALLSFLILGSGCASAKLTTSNRSQISIDAEANTVFASGKRCFIWTDSDTVVKEWRMDDSTTFVFLDRVSVICGPQTNSTSFLPCYRFIATEKTTGKQIQIAGYAETDPLPTARDKERSYFRVIMGDAKVRLSLSGIVTVYLIDSNDKKAASPPPISNTIEVDLREIRYVND